MVSRLCLQVFDPAGEFAVVVDAVQAQFLFLGQQIRHALQGRFDLFDEQPQRAAVDGQAPHVVQEQPVPAQQVVDRRHREVAQVLVVDGVELAVVDQVAHVGKLDDRHAVGLEQGGDAGHETVGVGHVGQHVVGVDDVGLLALGGQLLGQSMPKNSARLGTPIFSAASHRAGTGSMPSTGTPCST